MHIIFRVFKIIVYALLRIIGDLYPRNRMLIAIGAWQGKLFIDNPKYLLHYLLENTGYCIVWIGDEILRKQLPTYEKLSFARKGSIRAFFILLRARTWICCQSIASDLIGFPISGDACLIDLWHGIPIKKIGHNTPYAGKNSRSAKAGLLTGVMMKLMRHPTAWLAISSEKMGAILTDGVPERYSKEKMLRCGSPRNDFLILNANNRALIDTLKAKYANLLGYDRNKRVVLYLPTWRMCGDVFSFYNLSQEDQVKCRNMLDSQNAVLIEKHHFVTFEKFPLTGESLCSFVVDKSMQYDVDVQEMLLIADVLISDYSGAYIDFGLLKRPCIHYVYDGEQYENCDSGLAYELPNVVAGEIVYTKNALFDSLLQTLTIGSFKPGCDFAGLVKFEKGEACEKIEKFIDSQNCLRCEK